MLFITLLLASLYSTDLIAGDVVVLAGNSTLTFESTEAAFAPTLGGSGLSGMLMQGSPSDACSTLETLPSTLVASTVLIMLTMRGNCSFEDKVRNAQSAGFAAVIIYATDYLSRLVTMAGNSEGVHLHALFVSREAGETLLKYLGDENSDICLLPTTENNHWSVKVLTVVSVLASSAAVATWLFTKNQKIRRLCNKFLRQEEPRVLSPCIVRAMPCITYEVVGFDQKMRGNACGICLEDYKANQNLRVLPCRHRFHARCVDTWLTAWQASCPICKSNVWCDMSDLEALDRTPLLRPNDSSHDVFWGAKTAPLEVQLHSNARNYFTCSPRGTCESSFQKSGLQIESATTSSTGDCNSDIVGLSKNFIPMSSLTALCMTHKISAS